MASYRPGVSGADDFCSGVPATRKRDLHGRGAGWIDIHLLASAMVGHLRLWTADPRLAAMGNELGVAYETRG